VGGDADQERRLRREIANSNERRRMQSINAGFQSLRTLLPHHEGEKLSKAAILQQTAEYIYQLEQEKTRLLSQNSQLKRLYSLSQQGLTTPGSTPANTTTTEETTSPRLKKKRMTTTATANSLENTADLLKEEEAGTGSAAAGSVQELSLQLLNEQRLRMRLEERLKTLEQQQAAATSSVVSIVAAAAPPHPQPQREPQPQTNTVVTQQGNKGPANPPILPTQPLKMEVVNAVAAAGVDSTVQQAQRSAPTILLADKNGIRVEVEAVAGLPQTPVSLQQVSEQAPKAVPAAEELNKNLISTTSVSSAIVNNPQQQPQPASRSYIVTTGSAPQPQQQQGPVSASAASAAAACTRQNLDSIVEAIRHLEGDHMFSEDSHKVVKEEVVEYTTSTPIQQTSSSTNTNLSHHHVTVTKNLVPSKIVGLKPVNVSVQAAGSTVVTTTNPIPATLLPKQPHPPSAVLHQQSKSNEGQSSIIIVKSCQT